MSAAIYFDRLAPSRLSSPMGTFIASKWLNLRGKTKEDRLALVANHLGWISCRAMLELAQSGRLLRRGGHCAVHKARCMSIAASMRIAGPLARIGPRRGAEPAMGSHISMHVVLG